MDKLTNTQKGMFASQLETILASGLNVSDGLLIMSQDEGSSLAQLSKNLYDTQLRTGSFYEAVKESGVFDEYFCSMVRIGELNGQSDKVTREMAVYYQREDELDKAIRKAITYPFVLVVMMDVIIALLYFRIFPVFESVMSKAGIQNNSLINIASVLSLTMFVLLSIVIVLVFAYFLINRINKNDNLNGKLLEMLPFTRNIYNSVLLSRFTYALSLFVSSGYPVEESLKYLPDVTGKTKLAQKIKKVVSLTEEGVSVYEAFEKCGIYSGINQSFLNVGLKSGKQSETFEKLSDILQKESYEKIVVFVSIVEPVLVGVLSLIVGAIVISVMLPLVSILSSIG